MKKISSKTSQLTYIEITPKEVVKLTFEERVLIAPKGNEESSQEIVNEYHFVGRHKPHTDLLSALLGLRKFGLELNEFPTDATFRNQFTVRSVEIIGNMDLQQSRVSFTLNKFVKRTGKNIKIDVTECVMYGDDYKNASEMVKQIEALIKEVFEYVNGKNGEKIQLSFGFHEAVEA